VAPRTKPENAAIRVSPDHEAKLREALAELERGEVVELTDEELQHWVKTGEWPDSLD
jgi:hypothetical protein